MIKYNKLLKNIASLGVLQIANYLFPLLTVPIISRIIGPEKFGIINYLASFVSYFTLLIGYGFDLSSTRQLAKDPNNLKLRNQLFNEVFTAKLLLTGISIIVFLFCLYNFSVLYNEKKVALYSFLICISILFSQNWIFQAMQDLTVIAWLNFVSKLFFSIIVILFVVKEDDYVLQPLIMGVTQIIIAIVSLIWALKKYSIKFNFISFYRIIEVLQEGKMVFFSMVIISFYTTTNVIILGIYNSKLDVGYYTAAQRLMEVIRLVITLPISIALFPVIGKAFANGEREGLQLAKQILPLILITTGCIGLFMFIFAPWIFNVFYGENFNPSIVVFQILCFVPMIISLSNLFGVQILMNLKMDKIFFKVTLFGSIFSIVLNFLFSKHFGYIGTAFNWLFTEILISVTFYVILYKKNLNPVEYKYFNPGRIMKFITETIFEKNKYKD